MQPLETRYLTAEDGDEILRIDAAEGRAPKIVGYGMVFNRWSELISEGGLRFRERIAPEAVRRLTPEADLRYLVNHDEQKVLGRTRSGTMRYAVDSRGVRIEVDPPDTTYAHDAIESIRRGDLTGQSFRVLIAKRGDSWEMGRDGVPERTVHDIERFREFSVVTFPAYPDTTAAIRSLTEFQAEQQAQAPADPPGAGENPPARVMSIREAQLRIAERL